MKCKSPNVDPPKAAAKSPAAKAKAKAKAVIKKMQKRNQSTAPGSPSPGFRPSQLRQYSLASRRCMQTWPRKRGGRSCPERGPTRNS
eukprot:382279-Pyramimonas_sp.AAC.1